MRPYRRPGARVLVRFSLAFVWLAAASDARAEDEVAESASVEVAVQSESVEPDLIAVLPFQIHSARPLGYLTESLADLLAARLTATGSLRVADTSEVRARLDVMQGLEPDDLELRRLARDLGARAVISGSVTELAGRYSLDVRVTPAVAGARSQTIVLTAPDEEGLIARLDELAARVTTEVAGAGPVEVLSLTIEGAGDIEGELRERIQSRVGEVYDPGLVREDEGRVQAHPSIATVSIETDRQTNGVDLRFRVIRSEMIFGGGGVPGEGRENVSEVVIRGNRRIEGDAIRTRIRSRVGEPLREAQLADDVRQLFALGFFRNVQVYTEPGIDGGVVLIFEVEENPVVRQISIEGNDNVDSDKIRDILTLTTGATLDQPLLHENKERITSLYRAEGFYLADVEFEVETIAEGSVGINFLVNENQKLKLREINFIGNEEFTNKQLEEHLTIERWHWYSYATSWLDKSGTYSEPIFMRDLRAVEKLYTDHGFLQVEISEPKVRADEKGLFVAVEIVEGPQYKVGKIDVSGDETMDVEALRSKLQLSEGAVFNRSHLTGDVEALEGHYTDRGFYFASVQPQTRLSEEELKVDVVFRVEKGPLYFVRHINISGNTKTIDPVIRREMQVVEGQLYSARALEVSTRRVRGLGYFEDLTFEPQTTEDPSQLDLDLNVVERPTGSFSFGAGFSSQDQLVLTAAVQQSNLFGRGYGVNLSADFGGRSQRFFLSLTDPYFLGTTFSAGATFFLTDIRFDDFKQIQQGFDLSVGHSLREDNTARMNLRYSYSRRRIEQNTRVNAAAVIFREILQGNESSSLIGLNVRSDTRNDRFTPTAGTTWGATAEYSGLGGFAKFLRLEARQSWYLGAPSWMIDRSTFVVSSKIGWAIPFNDISDYDFTGVENNPFCEGGGTCVNVANLDQIDDDLKLPLTERYFLGGIGAFQLRGYEARSVGPRRSILQRNGLVGQGNLFSPVGTVLQADPANNVLFARCQDDPPFSQGNGNGKCNQLTDKDLDDFDDQDETDVIGGNKFVTVSFEYRFPISQEIGLQAVLFTDMGNAFAEGESLFDVDEWRYGYGGGLLWFSPFGPLQLVLGFPVEPESFDDSPVFEFSIGGFGI